MSKVCFCVTEMNGSYVLYRQKALRLTNMKLEAYTTIIMCRYKSIFRALFFPRQYVTSKLGDRRGQGALSLILDRAQKQPCHPEFVYLSQQTVNNVKRATFFVLEILFKVLQYCQNLSPTQPPT